MAHPRRGRTLLLGIPAGLLAVALALAAYLHLRYPTASPATSALYLAQNAGHSHAKLTRQVIGFLPYWRLDDSRYMHPDLLSEVIFFSLTAGPDGQIVKTAGNGPEPGWRWWNSPVIRNEIAKTQITGGTFSLTIAMQDPKQIAAFLQSPTAQQTLIRNLVDQIRSNKLNGLNLDFEVDGKAADQDRQAFTAFASDLVSAVHQRAPGTSLSIDLPPLAARTAGLYDVGTLAPLFDRVIVMSYDYYASSSDVAGPIAPMSGFQQGQYFFDVSTTYQDYLEIVPKDKLVMGVPYYGYDWPVEDGNQPLSPTLPQNDADGYAEILSYSRMKTDTDLKLQDCQWEPTAAETWCSYTDSQTNKERQVWFEDARSIGVKYDFARGQNLAGVAIWTLGYDGSYPELWALIRQDFAASA